MYIINNSIAARKWFNKQHRSCYRMMIIYAWRWNYILIRKCWLIVTQSLKQRFLVSVIVIILVRTTFTWRRESFTSQDHIREFFNVLSIFLITFVSAMIAHCIQEWQMKTCILAKFESLKSLCKSCKSIEIYTSDTEMTICWSL